MSKKNRQAKKKLKGKSRTNDAVKWLRSNSFPKDLLAAYCKRYGVSEAEANGELMQIGYYDELQIQGYQKQGIKWKYQVEPLSGDMFVVPDDAKEHELYEIHGIL